MENDRLDQILNFAEGLKQNPNGGKLLEGAIENTRRLKGEGAEVKRTLNILEQIGKAFKSIPRQVKNN